MKLLVFSDSHGSPAKMLEAIAQHSPDLIIHLGDSGSDLRKIETQFPQIPLRAVRGNCDFRSDLPDTDFFTVGKTKIFMTHGHLYSVKATLSLLADEARARGAELALFGHTHEHFDSALCGVRLINPGSCGHAVCPSYAELIISEKGETLCRIVRI